MSGVVAERSIDALVRFARLASETRTGAAILPLLADALVELAGADAVALLEIESTGEVKLVPSAHTPKELAGVEIDPDAIGEELGRQLLAACGGRYGSFLSRPLVSGGGLFGAVLMFFRGTRPKATNLAEGLVDLAAISIEAGAKLQQLALSHAELRASQDVLIRTEKLRALGEMAAGVSHDLKNILNPLSLHLQIIERAVARGHDAEVKEGVTEARQVLTRGVQTLERLRDYSRQSPESRAEHIELNHLIHEAAQIARPRMSARGGRLGRIVEELGRPEPVQGRSGEIVSALVNLIVNAIDASAGGTITLRTGSSEDGSWAQVSDDGPGMPPEIEKRVFEPFFTTKGQEGTGLGLAMVYACMQRHGGSVKLETAPGRGTTFTLLFPKTT